MTVAQWHLKISIVLLFVHIDMLDPHDCCTMATKNINVASAVGALPSVVGAAVPSHAHDARMKISQCSAIGRPERDCLYHHLLLVLFSYTWGTNVQASAGRRDCLYHHLLLLPSCGFSAAEGLVTNCFNTKVRLFQY
jgi:hypothetical protein